MTALPRQDPQRGWQGSIYDQLHRIAQRALTSELPGHSLQPTMLANDAYLKLLEQRNVDPGDRSKVLAAGANILRRLLVDHARQRKSQKRGWIKSREIPLHVSLRDSANPVDLLELNDALEVLAGHCPRAAQVVELKFFGGLSGEEMAEQLGVSLRTVNNDWRYAKAWLYRALRPGEEDRHRND